jgi:hypothetical protein
MTDHNFTISFLVVSDLFDRYTIVVNTSTKHTSVYCDECEQWVGRWEGDQLSQHSPNDLKQLIVERHEEQVLGHKVDFDEPKPLSIGDD